VIVRGGEGKRLMDEIRGVVEMMRQVEHNRLTERHASSLEVARATYWVLGLGSLLGFSLLGIATLRISHAAAHLSGRRRYW